MNNDLFNKDNFQLVEQTRAISDKEFEGKARGFLADAAIRFAKNKINLVAFFIVAFMILLSIIVPVVTTKDYTSPVVKNLQNLPPRIPFLENFGIADGTTEVINIPVDYSKPVEGAENLYYPLGTEYEAQYIKAGTLINTTLLSTNKNPLTLHGQNVIYLDNFKVSTVKSPEKLLYTNGQTLDINIQFVTPGTALQVYIDNSEVAAMTEDALLLGEITEEGEYTFLVNYTGNAYIYLVYDAKDTETSSLSRAAVEIIDIKVSLNDSEVAYYEGYSLSQFKTQVIPNQGGRYERINGEYTVASFRYYIYNKIFANVPRNLTGTSSGNDIGFLEYLEMYPALKAEFAEQLALIEESTPSSGEVRIDFDYTFEEEGVPIRKVNYVIIRYNVFAGIVTYTYNVEMDGAFFNGFDSMPHFWFGTDKDGRDLFAQIWLSLRTSLFLGLIVSIINIVIGVIYGAVEGYYGGTVDFIMERFSDYIASFPGLTILTIIYLNYGPGLLLLLIYLTYSGWIGTAATTRIQFYRYRGREYVLASKSLGASDPRLIFKHILPNSIGIIVTRSILSIPSMIFVEASLSFLGFGIGRGVTLDFGLFKMPGLSLGVILQEGQGAMLIPGRFYQLLIPSIIIIILMISFNMFGNALRDALNPTLRGQEK